MRAKIFSMGKCKRRTLAKNSSYYMTREEAVSKVFDILNVKKKKLDMKSAISTISLFGISAEELSEAGVPWENLEALGMLID